MCIMCLRVSYKKKYEKNWSFLHPKSSELDLDPLVRGTDPRIWIRIRTKMSRIPNTDHDANKFLKYNESLT